MAGLGRKTFIATEVLTAANVNGYLMDQTVMKYANTTAASSAIGTALSEGMQFYLSDTDEQVFYNGSSFAKQNAGQNAIINGAFDIWQRGTSGNFTGSGYSFVGADRWWVYGYNASSTLSQQTFTPGTAPVAGYEGAYFARFNSTNTANFFGTRLDDVRQFAGQTATLSFWAKSNAGQTLTLTELEQNFGSGGSASVYTSLTNPTLTTSWARYTITVSVPSISGKNVGTSSFIQLGFKGAINNAIDIWGVQLESGSTATAFKRNASNIQGELAACQRYYVRWNASGGNPYAPYTRQCVASSSTSATGYFSMPVEMRTSPTSVEYATLGITPYPGTTVTTVTSATLATNDPKFVVVNIGVSSGLSTGTSYTLLANNSSTAYFGISAEL